MATKKRNSKPKPLTKQGLKQFRHKISILKSQGVIPGKKLDARTARPGMRRGGKSLDKLLHEFKDVAEGRAKAVPKHKLARGVITEQKKLGNKTRGKFLLVKQTDQQKVAVSGGDVVKTAKLDPGLVQVQIVRKKGETLEAFAGRAEKIIRKHGLRNFSATVYGNRIHGSYAGPNWFSDFLGDIKRNYKANPQFLSNLTIVGLKDRKAWRKK